MIKNGKFSQKFYKIEGTKYILKTKQEFEECENRKIAEHKTYRKVIKLEDLINYYPHSVFREKGLS